MREPDSPPAVRYHEQAPAGARGGAHRRALLLGAVLALTQGPENLLAFCNSAIETYAIFQCAQKGYFAPVPPPHSPSSVTGLFWQVGFGNGDVSTGLGSDGTGVSGGVFNGNDSGSFRVNFVDAAASFPAEGFPPGSICLGSNNWANTGVDGCCDNPRPGATFEYTNAYSGLGPYTYRSDDNILNPYFGTFQSAQGFPGYYSLASIMDYPVAVLARTPGDEYFAVAAVTNGSRNSNGARTPSDCLSASPANPAACDMRQGSWHLSDVRNGLPNVLPGQAGKSNVIPWQRPPVPVLGGERKADAGGASVSVDVSWPAVSLQHDGRSVPSNNPTLATRNPALPRDPAASPGVGVPDLLGRFGLVRYQIQVAGVEDTGFRRIVKTVECPGDPACTSATSATLTLDRSQCVRIRTLFGMRPRVPAPSAQSCRLGRCGDTGYGVDGPRACPEACAPDPGGEICNEIDDDCDGRIDEDFPIGEECEGAGECGPGVVVCSFLDPGATQCSTEPGGWQDQSETEICDGLDNDCNGAADEGFGVGGACDAGGVCGGGTLECNAAGTGAVCSTGPGGSADRSSAEICDNLDNDCDGAVDGFPTACGVGTCASAGACSTGSDSCAPGAPSEEVCDTLDNDCDGSTDEDFDLGEACRAEGECGEGVAECGAGGVSPICSTEPGGSEDGSSEEICDGLDNDCDGSTDEDFVLGEPCVGKGACGAGVTECTPEAAGPICSTGPGGSADQSSSEICDGVDNDCDGIVDGFPTQCGVGACASAGVCAAGGDTCASGKPAAETCDTLDHDCDGIAANPAKSDRDGDGIDDGCDNCPDVPNPGQLDADGNGTGDACEPGP